MPEPLDDLDSSIPSPLTSYAAVSPFPLNIYHVRLRTSSSLHLIHDGNLRVNKDTTATKLKMVRRVQLTIYIQAEEIVQEIETGYRYSLPILTCRSSDNSHRRMC